MDRRTDSRTWAICRVTEWDFALSGAAAVRGVVAVSALAGIVFGLQPARRAARV